MMFHHDIPEFMPTALGLGGQYKASVTTISQPATALFAKDRKESDQKARIADRWFLATLIALYGGRPFPRGNLDAGRLNRLFAREIVPAAPEKFDAQALNADLRIELDAATKYLSLIG